MKVTEFERKESTKRCCGSGWAQRDSAEHEGYAGALIERRITEKNVANADRPTVWIAGTNYKGEQSEPRVQTREEE